jgi:hypothetical protein
MSRNIVDFAATWHEWSNIAEPNWQQCKDESIGTSFLTINDVISQIEKRHQLKYPCAYMSYPTLAS